MIKSKQRDERGQRGLLEWWETLELILGLVRVQPNIISNIDCCVYIKLIIFIFIFKLTVSRLYRLYNSVKWRTDFESRQLRSWKKMLLVRLTTRVWLCLLQSCTNVFYLFLRHFPCPQVGVLRSWWQMYLAVAVIRIFSRLTTSIKMRPSHHLPPASCLLPPSSHMLIAITSCLTVDCSNCFTGVKHNIDARNIFLMYYNVS